MNTPQMIEYLDRINGTDTVVGYNGIAYTVSGLIQRKRSGVKVITVELTPCNGADSLIYCRVQDIERREE